MSVGCDTASWPPFKDTTFAVAHVNVRSYVIFLVGVQCSETMGSCASCILVQYNASDSAMICGGSGMGGVGPALARICPIVWGKLIAFLPMLAVTSAHSLGGKPMCPG